MAVSIRRCDLCGLCLLRLSFVCIRSTWRHHCFYDIQTFVLHTDACLGGLGAVLYQLVDGREHVIAYASRSLNKAEKKYPAHKLEFLALKWAVTKKFHNYLYGNNFTVYTDNNPLTYVLTTAKLDATGHSGVSILIMF